MCFLVSGGRQAGLPQHLQDHGLRGLLQVSTLGETAGKRAAAARSELPFDYVVVHRPVLLCLWTDSGIRDVAEDFVFRATDRSAGAVRYPAARIPAESAGDRVPVQRLRKVIESVRNVFVIIRIQTLSRCKVISSVEQKLCENHKRSCCFHGNTGIHEKMSFPWISTGFLPASGSCRTSESCWQRNSDDEYEDLL